MDSLQNIDHAPDLWIDTTRGKQEKRLIILQDIDLGQERVHALVLVLVLGQERAHIRDQGHDHDLDLDLDLELRITVSIILDPV